MSEIETEVKLPVGAGNTGEGASTSPANQAEEPVDPQLITKLDACKQFSRIHKILENGIFPGGMAPDLAESMQFIRTMHGPIWTECQAHKDYLRVTDPAKYKAEKEAAEAKAKAEARADEKRQKKAKKFSILGLGKTQ